jgi:EpsI family protein
MSDRRSPTSRVRRVIASLPFDRWQIATAATVAVSFVYCYADVIAKLVTQWITRDAYSHGFLIPPVSAYLVWRKRASFMRGGGPRWLGAGVVAAGLALLLLGRFVGVLGMQELSLVVTLLGLVLWLLGPGALRSLAFPILYLLIAMPVWDVVTERLYYPSQLFSARAAAYLIGALSIPVARQATYLYLPNVTLEVADACSGINYLIAVVAVGVPLAYLHFEQPVKRVALVTVAVATAVVANPVRVALIAILLYKGLTEQTHGPWHVLQGLFVSAVGFVALFVAAWVIGKLPPHAHSASVAATESPADALEEVAPVGRAGMTAAVACGLLIAVGLLRPLAWPPPAPLPVPLASLPSAVGGWSVTAASLPAAEELAVAPDEVWRTYRSADGDSIELYIGRFAKRSVDTGCVRYLADSFDFVNPERLGPEGTDDVVISRAVFRATGGQRRILFWYDLGGRLSSSRAAAKAYTAWVALTHLGRPPLVVVVLPLFDGPSDGSEPLATKFARALYPAVQRSLYSR